MFSPIYISTELHNGSATVATGDYSTISNNFVYQVPSGRIAAITRMIIFIGDVGDFDPDVYGAGSDPLTNGVEVLVTNSNDTTIQYITSNSVAGTVGQYSHPIKTNGDWQALCYDFHFRADVGNQEDIGVFRWTFARAGMPLILSNQEKFCIKLNDDFSGLVDHRFTIQGLEAPENSHNLELFMRQLST